MTIRKNMVINILILIGCAICIFGYGFFFVVKFKEMVKKPEIPINDTVDTPVEKTLSYEDNLLLEEAKKRYPNDTRFKIPTTPATRKYYSKDSNIVRGGEYRVVEDGIVLTKNGFNNWVPIHYEGKWAEILGTWEETMVLRLMDFDDGEIVTIKTDRNFFKVTLPPLTNEVREQFGKAWMRAYEYHTKQKAPHP